MYSGRGSKKARDETRNYMSDTPAEPSSVDPVLETPTHLPSLAARRRRDREHRRRRLRRHGRRAYIRSVYFLPSLATLGNAICGFGAMYVAAFDKTNVGGDPWAQWMLTHKFLVAAYLIFGAMIFDALDGRLARFTRHTTDFGGQLDSLADVISFGAAPAFLALLVFKDPDRGPQLSFAFSRLIWAIGALYMSCAALRLARFNVSNEHGEQHHFSFLGLPSPGAAGAVAALVLMEEDLRRDMPIPGSGALATFCVYLLPLTLLLAGLLMVSHVRYPHFANRYLRGRKSIAKLLFAVAVLLLVVVAHRYVLGIGMMIYVAYGAMNWLWRMIRIRYETRAR
jgi:CDP-diacylglycerol---serine O-phosphatidyltransferase